MQRRMRNFQLTGEQIDSLLKRAPIACISTLDAEGYPYCVPVHFVKHEGRLFFHGLDKGKKLDNLARNNKVCFSAYDMKGIVHAEEPEYMCNVNTEYESVVIRGRAERIEDMELKRDVLLGIVRKYAPEVMEAPMLERAVENSAVVEIVSEHVTGKYYVKKSTEKNT